VDDDEHELVEIEGDYVDGNDLSAMEESLVHRFLDSSKQENRTLADIIMNKIREKEDDNEDLDDSSQQVPDVMPPKVCHWRGEMRVLSIVMSMHTTELLHLLSHFPTHSLLHLHH
jgi:hypothetical protein